MNGVLLGGHFHFLPEGDAPPEWIPYIESMLNNDAVDCPISLGPVISKIGGRYVVSEDCVACIPDDNQIAHFLSAEMASQMLKGECPTCRRIVDLDKLRIFIAINKGTYAPTFGERIRDTLTLYLGASAVNIWGQTIIFGCLAQLARYTMKLATTSKEMLVCKLFLTGSLLIVSFLFREAVKDTFYTPRPHRIDLNIPPVTIPGDPV